MPSNAELLYELRKHGAKPPPRGELPPVSRRTRDFLLCAGLAGAVVGLVCWRLVSGSDPANAVKLALTGLAVVWGLLGFVFFGVMSRY